MPSYKIRINGSDRVVDSSDPDQPLLYVLRNIGLTAAKFGCGLGQCGACSVLIDGRSERSCVMTIAAAEGRAITTLEGLGSAAKPQRDPDRFHQRAGAAMRILHERHDRERDRAACEQSEAD